MLIPAPGGRATEITNPVREYAEKGMAEMSEKFEAEGGELYDESFDEEGAKKKSVAE